MQRVSNRAGPNLRVKPSPYFHSTAFRTRPASIIFNVHFYFDDLIYIYKFNLSSLTSQRRKAEPEHKMIKYMKPLKMFQETLKRTIDMRESVFIGFNVTDKSVSLAVSDHCYLGAYGYDVCPRDQTLLDNLVSKVQHFNKDYDLEGIIVASEYHDSPPMNIHNLIHDLCKKGKFQSLKFACYTDNVTSPRAKYHSHLWSGITEIYSAVHMLQANLDVFNTLVERENKYISDYSIEDYPKKDYDSDEDFSE